MATLTPHVGPKTALTLHQFARGIDTRPLEQFQTAKSISAEISYGVRLDSEAIVVEFIGAIATEVHARLVRAGFVAATVTLKLKTRQAGAPIEPVAMHGYLPFHVPQLGAYTTQLDICE